MKANLTDAYVKSLPAPTKGSQTYWDGKLSGFGVRVMKSGVKTFVVRYIVDGIERQEKIGPYPLLGLAAARARAEEVRAKAHLGVDIKAERRARIAASAAAKSAPTVADLRRKYLEEYVAHRRTEVGRKNEAHYWRQVEASLGSATKIAEVTTDDVARMHAELSKATPVSANRVVVSLKTAMNLARRAKWISENPCVGVPLNKEQARERYLSAHERTNLLAALDAWVDQQAALAIRLLLATGARRSEITHATWVEFDLVAGNWNKPASNTKSGRPHSAPLSREAIHILKQLGGGPGAAGRVLDRTPAYWGNKIERHWRGIREAASLPDVRLHDLRHSYASILANAGSGLPTIGALLGHQTVSTTQRYAHLVGDTLRAATQAVGDVLSSSASNCN